MRIVLKKLGVEDLYAEQKDHDNAMMLEMEEEIAGRIAGNADPLLTALKYSFTGNYLDYGAMKTVSKETLLALLEEAEPVSYTHLSAKDCESQRPNCARERN